MIHFTASPLESYQIVVLGFVILLFCNASVNLFVFRKPQALLLPDEGCPFVSVLIPARDEEGTIEACVRSCLTQTYPNFEVVVIDDGSADSTYLKLCHLRDQDFRLRVLVGAEAPSGWTGKTNACWQLARASQGEYLLFTDADCVLTPEAILLAVGAQEQNRADVVSLMPHYVALSFWEKVVIPLLTYIPFAFLPIWQVRGSKSSLYSAANGSFLFLSRSTYFEIGGHEAVKGELAEDIKFGQNVKRRGKTLWYGDGHLAYSVRMYSSLHEIWEGFTRNLFPAFSAKLGLTLGVIAFIVAVFVLPPFWAVAGLTLGAAWTWICAVQYLLLVILRLIIALRFDNDDPTFAVLNPLSWAVAAVVAAGSIARYRSGTVAWKGRSYGGTSKKDDA